MVFSAHEDGALISVVCVAKVHLLFTFGVEDGTSISKLSMSESKREIVDNAGLESIIVDGSGREVSFGSGESLMRVQLSQQEPVSTKWGIRLIGMHKSLVNLHRRPGGLSKKVSATSLQHPFV